MLIPPSFYKSLSGFLVNGLESVTMTGNWKKPFYKTKVKTKTGENKKVFQMAAIIATITRKARERKRKKTYAPAKCMWGNFL